MVSKKRNSCKIKKHLNNNSPHLKTPFYVYFKSDRVTGSYGEAYICTKGALKKKSERTEEGRKECIPDSFTGGGPSVGG